MAGVAVDLPDAGLAVARGEFVHNAGGGRKGYRAGHVALGNRHHGRLHRGDGPNAVTGAEEGVAP